VIEAVLKSVDGERKSSYVGGVGGSARNLRSSMADLLFLSQDLRTANVDRLEMGATGTDI
jgi:hypothetical protein